MDLLHPYIYWNKLLDTDGLPYKIANSSLLQIQIQIVKIMSFYSLKSFQVNERICIFLGELSLKVIWHMLFYHFS